MSRLGRFGTELKACTTIVALVVLTAWPARAMAQDDHSHGITPPRQELTRAEKQKEDALVEAVRAATRRFQNVAVAQAEGYALQFGCVSGDDFGAMGLHFINGPLVADGELDVARPEIILYEPQPNGQVKLTGADYLVDAATWDAAHDGPPQLMGQLFHLFDSPNRFGLKAFYTLHVWAWKENPKGTFTNWNPNVSCDAFSGQNH